MFDFLKREAPERRSLREQFEKVTARIQRAEEFHQAAIGHSINLTYSTFLKAYGSTEAFQSLPQTERISYINRLTVMEDKVRDEMGDPLSSLGVAVFKMWVGAVTANDLELMEQFSREISRISKKGDAFAP